MNNSGFRKLLVLLTFIAGAFSSAQTTAKQELKIWGGYTEMLPFFERVADDISADFPDIDFVIDLRTAREFESRVDETLNSGSTDPMILAMYLSLATPYLEEGLLKKAPAEISEFVNDAGNFGLFFTDGASYKGEVYSVPLIRSQDALFYNTEMFAAAGLSGPPQTIEEYSDYASKLTQRDKEGNPLVSGWSLRFSGGGWGVAEKFWINMFQYGGNIIEKSHGKWRSGMATEAAQRTLEQYLNNVHLLKNGTLDMPGDADAFAKQETAMFIRESWVVGKMEKEAPDVNYATAPLPGGSIAIGVNLYVANAEGEVADAAWAFAKASNKPEHLNWLLRNVGWLPNRSNVDFSAILKEQPGFSGFIDTPMNYLFFTYPPIGGIDEVLTTVSEKLTEAYGNAALAGDRKAQEAVLQEIDYDINTFLERKGLLDESVSIVEAEDAE